MNITDDIRYVGVNDHNIDLFEGMYRVPHGMALEGIAMKYVCDVCGWVYDEEEGAPDMGIEPGTKFEALPEDFLCPLCYVGKDYFSEINE